MKCIELRNTHKWNQNNFLKGGGGSWSDEEKRNILVFGLRALSSIHDT